MVFTVKKVLEVLWVKKEDKVYLVDQALRACQVRKELKEIVDDPENLAHKAPEV